LATLRELFTGLAAYNVWAHHRLLFAMQQLPENDWLKHTPSSFSSLYKTCLHIWDAESIWWQRMRLHERLVIPSESFEPGIKDLCNGLLHQSMEWESFIANEATETVLLSPLYYANLKGQSFSQPVWQVLQHVFNHSTYHRGQLVSMLRALGVAHIPQTDFIDYSRKKDPAE
jgi:uncharacterized damage-inducible protein DinB